MTDRRFKVRSTETPKKVVLHFDRQELRPAVQRFAEEMERVLCENDHKNGWEDLHHSDLMERITQERDELLLAENAYLNHDTEANRKRMIHEAVDIANFCMMLFEE
jgi:hypothetical protein